MRVALGIESLLNVPFGGMALLYPAAFLKLLVSDPALITPAAEMCSRFYGSTMFGATVPMVFGIFNNRTAIESRPYSYLMLAGMEVSIIATALWVIKGPGASSGFAPDAMREVIKQIGPAFLWRLFVFSVKPHWFGRYREVNKSL